MKKIHSTDALRNKILELETKRETEGEDLRQQFNATYESIKPVNIIKNSLMEVVESGDIKDSIVNTTVGMSAGYLAKKVYVGASKNPIKNLIGTALMFGVSKLVSLNPETIKSMGEGLMNMFKRKPSEDMNESEYYENN